MKFTVPAECQPTRHDIVNYRIFILIRLPGFRSNIVLYSFLVMTILLLVTGHRHFCRRHEMIKFSAHHGISNCLLFCHSLCLLKSYHFSKVLILVNQNHCRIKAKHVLVPDSIRNTVAVKLITENICRCAQCLLVFRKDRCPCKAKEQRIRKGCLNSREHLTEGRPVALINDKDKALLLHLFQVFGAHLAGSILFDIAHLLDGRDDQRILRISTLQFGNERNGILCLLHIICIVCKGAVFFQRLCAELDPIHQEYDLVRILGIGNKLCRLKRRHGFA